MSSSDINYSNSMREHLLNDSLATHALSRWASRGQSVITAGTFAIVPGMLPQALDSDRD